MTRAFPFRLGLTVAFLGLYFTSDNAPLRAQDDAGQKVYKQGLKSAVFVLAPRSKGAAGGSGSLIDAQKKLVLTNDHVVGPAKEVIVFFPIYEKGKIVNEKDRYLKKPEEGVFYRGKVLHKDGQRDLALIELDKVPSGVAPVRFAADSPSAGQNVHSIGNPAASDAFWIYTPGKVRSVYKKTWNVGNTEYKSVIIEATSPTSPGDSGGPLFNDKGEQIGVTQGGLVDPKAQGFSYFIDVSEVKAFLKEHKISVNSAPPSKETTVVKTDEPKTTSSEDKDEKAAAATFSLIKPLASDPAKKNVAIERLKELLQKYPKTKVAKDAEELLNQLRK